MMSGTSSARRILGLVALAAFEAAAIALLHELGSLRWMQVPWNDIAMWLDLAPLEDVVAASLRTVALGIAYWMAGSSALYLVARATRVPGLIRATAWATLPPIRRVIDRAVAVTVTTAALVAPIAPALADEAPPTTEPIIYQISEQGVPTPVNPPPVDPTHVAPPGTAGGGYTPNPAGGVEVGADPTVAGETFYEVVRGDNLWTISAAHLAAATPQRDVEPSEISVYWRSVIVLNTPQLRSGDPNLIYPGEQIVLPPIDIGDDT